MFWYAAAPTRQTRPSDRRAGIGVACLAPIGALAGIAPSAATAIAVTCLVAFLTQCWSTNTATLVAEVMPNFATASTMGLMGTAGSLAGACFAQVLGYVIQSFGYPAAFALAAILHPCAAVILLVMLRGFGIQNAVRT